MHVVGLILAGGQARRMGGGDKTLLDLAGRPMLAHIVERLAPQVDALALSANGDPARFARFGLPVLPDAVAGEGPLGGVLTGLRWAAGNGAGTLVTVPGDTPFPPLDLAVRLLPGPAYAIGPEREHPLLAAWPVAATGPLAALLSAPGSRAVLRFLRQIGARPVTFPSEAGFRNLNTPDDLADARRDLVP